MVLVVKVGLLSLVFRCRCFFVLIFFICGPESLFLFVFISLCQTRKLRHVGLSSWQRKQRDGERKKIRRREAMASGPALVRFKAVAPSVGDLYNRHIASIWKKMDIKNNKSCRWPITKLRFQRRKFFFLLHAPVNGNTRTGENTVENGGWAAC